MKNKTTILLSIGILLMANKVSKAQDTIFKKNNDIVIAKIHIISATEVKYSRSDLPDGPTYTSNKSDIIKIKYANGLVDDFSLPEKKKENNASVIKNGNSSTLAPDYILTMVDGTQLRGKKITETKNAIVFLDNNIGEKTINKDKIKSIKSEYGEQIRIFTLVDGSILSGKIVSQNESVTVIETKDLGTITLPSSKIKSEHDLEDGTITHEGAIWFKNPNCTRYLFAPSAICLRKGEGYYQNIYGAGNAVNFGITDNISIGGGLVGPVGVYINSKIGFQISDNVHLAAGFLAGNGFFPIDGNNLGVAVGFSVLTIGNYDHNITIGAGYGVVNNEGETKWQEKPLFVANGMARVGRKYALVTENWIVNTKGDPFGRGITAPSHYETYFSYAFRYMGERTTLDAGFINTPALIEKGWYVGIPYIGFVIRFGKYKEG